MSDFRDRAKDAMESATDIARDKLDTFKKLSETQQKIVLGVLAGVFLIVMLWLFWPSSVDITVERSIVPVAGNYVAILNNEDFDIKKITVVINERYEYKIDLLPAGQTTEPLYVTKFYPIGNPEGQGPGPDFVPQIIKVTTNKGTMTRKFK